MAENKLTAKEIEAILAENTRLKATAENLENTLVRNGITAAPTTVVGTHKVESVESSNPFAGKTIKFKAGHNYLRLPAVLVAKLTPTQKAKLVPANGVTFAGDAINEAVVMEYLAGIQSAMIEVAEAEPVTEKPAE